MREIHASDIKELCGKLNAAYNRTVSEKGGSAWMDALAGMDAGSVFDAWRKWVREQKRAPTPADLVALVRGSGAPLDTRGANGPRGCERCRWSGWRYVAVEVVDDWGTRAVLAATQCACDKGRAQGQAEPSRTAYTSARQVMDLEWSLAGLQVAQGMPAQPEPDPGTMGGQLGDLIRGVRDIMCRQRASEPVPALQCKEDAEEE